MQSHLLLDYLTLSAEYIILTNEDELAYDFGVMSTAMEMMFEERSYTQGKSMANRIMKKIMPFVGSFFHRRAQYSLVPKRRLRALTSILEMDVIQDGVKE